MLRPGPERSSPEGGRGYQRTDTEQGLTLLEVKSGETVASDWFKALNTFPGPVAQRGLIHGGAVQYEREGVQVWPWWAVGSLGIS
jgi:hypothetical protein